MLNPHGKPFASSIYPIRFAFVQNPGNNCYCDAYTAGAYTLNGQEGLCLPAYECAHVCDEQADCTSFTSDKRYNVCYLHDEVLTPGDLNDDENMEFFRLLQTHCGVCTSDTQYTRDVGTFEVITSIIFFFVVSFSFLWHVLCVYPSSLFARSLPVLTSITIGSLLPVKLSPSKSSETTLTSVRDGSLFSLFSPDILRFSSVVAISLHVFPLRTRSYHGHLL